MTEPTSEAGEPSGFGYVLRLLFGLRLQVTRKAYVIAGFGLMLLKYGMDSGVIYFTTGQLYSPLRFLSPLFSTRVPEVIRGGVMGETTALLIMGVYALVFMWIGVSMTVRRAASAGGSPWAGILFLVPFINVLVMLILALAPDKEASHWEPTGGFYRTPGPQKSPDQRVPVSLSSALKGVAAGVLIGGGMVLVSVFGLAAVSWGSGTGYGLALFFFTPFIMGTTTAYFYNMREPQGLGRTLLISMIPIAFTAGGLLLLALEGVICIAMATPIAVVIAVGGALIGYIIPQHRGATAAHSFVAALALPLLAGAEAKLYEPPTYEVVSSIEIDAPPGAVWPNVIGFSELPPPTELEFKLGIAYPMRARIDGHGVGAIRHCEFSTGAFVEPITRWEPPTRLSFDVSAQPPAMKHWSPVRHFHGYHLGASIESQRGEFRLIALPGGRTRLEGSTWYQLKMAPPAYWRVWSDSLIHAIHGRVLHHIKELTERPRRR